MVYVLLADGFEEIEALAPIDFLRRAGVEVESVSISGLSVSGAHGIVVQADRKIQDVCFSDISMLILPGGMPGTRNLDAYPQMSDLLSAAYENGAVLGAICAAPLVLGKRGYLEGREATCYPGFESELKGAILSARSVVRDGRIVTAKSAAFAWEFGCVLAEILAGKERCEAVRKSLYLPEYGV